MVAANRSVAFLLCEIGTWAYILGLLMEYWENDTEKNIWQNSSDSLALLICAIASIQNTWNHLVHTYFALTNVRSSIIIVCNEYYFRIILPSN